MCIYWELICVTVLSFGTSGRSLDSVSLKALFGIFVSVVERTCWVRGWLF